MMRQFMTITVTRTLPPGVLIADTPFTRDERRFSLEAWPEVS
jgi:hypothetical protein